VVWSYPPKGIREALEARASLADRMQHIHCHRRTPLAQQVPPYTYPQVIGTSSVTVLPPDPARKKVVFHNPNDTAKIAVCPVGPSRAVGSSQSLIVAVINGAGCLTILPYDRVEVSGSTAVAAAKLRRCWQI
jgi:hypothetical protein